MNLDVSVLKLLRLVLKEGYAEKDRKATVALLEEMLASTKSKYNVGDVVMIKEDSIVGKIKDIEQVIDTGKFYYKIKKCWVAEEDIAFKYNYIPNIGDKVTVNELSGIVQEIYDCRDYIPEPAFNFGKNSDEEIEYSRSVMVSYALDLTLEEYNFSPWVKLYIEEADMSIYVPMSVIKEYEED